jgi:hypothetical protein
MWKIGWSAKEQGPEITRRKLAIAVAHESEIKAVLAEDVRPVQPTLPKDRDRSGGRPSYDQVRKQDTSKVGPLPPRGG